MESSKITKGQVVKLKSGGPKMVVKKHYNSDLWAVNWFTSDDELKEGYFTAEQLDLISEE